MAQNMVTVIMPSYNHAEFVGKAIESVLKQTYTDFEFLIADDASVDNSVEIISRYNDPRIKFTKFEENTGFGASEYIYSQAKGKYIASICSDDMWDEKLLEKYVDFLEQNEEYGCCFCVPEVIGAEDEKIEDTIYNRIFTSENMTREQWFKRFYMRGNCICAPSMCIRRSVFEKVGPFRFQYRQLQDYELWMKLVQVTNIYIYPEKLMKYRVHPEGSNQNISTPGLESQLRDRMERKYIMYDIIDDVEESFFIKAFENELVLRPEDEGFCVECEKFGIMVDAPIVPVQSAIFYYFKHYNEEKFRRCLENFYHVTRKEFWKLSGADYDNLEECIRNQNLVKEMTTVIQQLEKLLMEKENKLQAINAILRTKENGV